MDKRLARYGALLQEVFLFHGLTHKEIVGLLRRDGISLADYPAGKVLLSAEESASQLGILLQGSAVVEKAAGENAQSLLRMSELMPGAIFGMAALFLDAGEKSFPTRIISHKRVEVLMIPEQVLREMLSQDFRLAENYIRYLTGRIHFLNARIDGLILPTMPQRVMLYLQQNATQGYLTHGLTQLAQALCISRATLYRALDILEQNGEIRRNGRHIELVGMCEMAFFRGKQPAYAGAVPTEQEEKV